MNECCYNQGKGKSQCRWLCDCVCCGRRLARYVDVTLSNPGKFIIFQMRMRYRPRTKPGLGECDKIILAAADRTPFMQSRSAQSCPSASLFNRGASFHTGRAANTQAPFALLTAPLCVNL